MNGFQILLLILSTDLAIGVEIVSHPSSLLVPINKIGIFTCKAHCVSCSGYWVIDGLYTDPEDQFIEKGYMFPPMQRSDNETLMILRVNVSEVVNNSVISCEFDSHGGEGCRSYSRNAKLLVITSSPLSNNLMLVKNNGYVEVRWSPPFLWPGRAIEYYNVSLVLESDGSVYSERINSTFSDPLVSYTQPMSGESLSCAPFTFYITAINSSGSAFQTFNITSSSPRMVFPPLAINGSVLYKSDGTPALLEVYLQLPNSSCTLNYTLLIEDGRDATIKLLGPFPHAGSAIDVVKLHIAISDLKINHFYSLTAQAHLYLQVTLSNKHHFNTSLENWNANTHSIANTNGNTDSEAMYKAATGVSLTIAVVTLLASAFVIIIFYIRQRRIRTVQISKESKKRIHASMVLNPIYDGDGDGGPVYDSIKPQYETLPVVAPPRFTETHQGSSSVMKSVHSDDVDVTRYVDQPVQLPQFRSQSFAHNTTITDNIDGESPSRMMALKKNGQERNKLHLTLNLGGSDAGYDGHNTEAPSIPVPSHTTATAAADSAEPAGDESYMVMNSARTVLSSIKNVGSTPQDDA